MYFTQHVNKQKHALTSRKSRVSRTLHTLPLSRGCVGWSSLESPVPRQGGNAASRAVNPTKVCDTTGKDCTWNNTTHRGAHDTRDKGMMANYDWLIEQALFFTRNSLRRGNQYTSSPAIRTKKENCEIPEHTNYSYDCCIDVLLRATTTAVHTVLLL